MPPEAGPSVPPMEGVVVGFVTVMPDSVVPTDETPPPPPPPVEEIVIEPAALVIVTPAPAVSVDRV